VILQQVLTAVSRLQAIGFDRMTDFQSSQASDWRMHFPEIPKECGPLHWESVFR